MAWLAAVTQFQMTKKTTRAGSRLRHGADHAIRPPANAMAAAQAARKVINGGEKNHTDALLLQEMTTDRILLGRNRSRAMVEEALVQARLENDRLRAEMIAARTVNHRLREELHASMLGLKLYSENASAAVQRLKIATTALGGAILGDGRQARKAARRL